MLTAACHCGAVRVTVPRAPETLTNCNCSACRRYGALWAYYAPAEVRIQATPDALGGYVWGDRTLRFVRCAHCGVITHWAPMEKDGTRMGVNMRLFEPDDLGDVRIRRLDGAQTWEYLD